MSALTEREKQLVDFAQRQEIACAFRCLERRFATDQWVQKAITRLRQKMRDSRPPAPAEPVSQEAKR